MSWVNRRFAQRQGNRTPNRGNAVTNRAVAGLLLVDHSRAKHAVSETEWPSEVVGSNVQRVGKNRVSRQGEP